MKRFLGLFLLILINIPASIQAQGPKKKTGYVNSSINTNAGIIPGVVVIKLKPEFRQYSNDLKALQNHPLLSESVKKYEVQKFEKMLPTSKPPVNAINNKGKKSTDISLIHVIHFNARIPVQELIDKLNASGIVEYAEPRYEDNILYIPNDPYAQSGQDQSLVLDRINAYKAWDIEKGDTNVVIGIIDTGTELNHPDIVNNIKYNYADPINGADDDNDGYIDNFHGWDVGSSTMGDNDPTWQGDDHGLSVHGAATATPDNNIGVVGTGFNCKSIPVKITNSAGNIVAGYQGIQYAAEHGVKVMNLSWGGFSGYSQASQDIINYAAIDHDVLIVASAGNTEGDLDFYPASYDNVISVAGLDTVTSVLYDTLVERRVSFGNGQGMTYSFHVDMATEVGSYSTKPSGTYALFAGSSYSSPVVAGAAALVRSKYPQLSALQAAELLRANGDLLDTFDVTRPESRYKIGRKLNMYKALTNITSPSVRMMNLNIKGRYDTSYFGGDTLSISGDFLNYLSKTNNLTIKMMCINGQGTMLNDVISFGSIDSLQSKNNLTDLHNAFKIIINNNVPSNQMVEMVMIMTDPSKNYYDYQGFKFMVNSASYLNLDTNNLQTTITSIGRIGYNTYETSSPSDGIGTNYLANPLLYEAGFMIGTSASKVSDCVRGNPGTYDREFNSLQGARYLNPGLKDMEIYSVFNDSLAPAPNVIGVQIEQRSYAWKNTADDNFVILEYKITNKSSLTYDSIFAGIFADWDVYNYAYNRADWDSTKKMAYTYCTIGGTKTVGVSLLTDNAPSCFSMDNSNVGGNNINPNNGFSTSKKFTTLAKGVYRKQAGMTGFGNDVSQVTAAKITNFAPGDVETVAFAIIGADNILALSNAAQTARDKFVSIHQGPVPAAPNVSICRKDTLNITFTPTNGNKFAFFSSPPPATPLYVGTSYTLNHVSNADTLYIANDDSLFYSNIKSVFIQKDNMDLEYFPSTDTIVIAQGSPLLLVNQSSGTSSISWDLGDGNTASSNSVSHTYNTAGFYNIKLSGIGTLNCHDTLTRVLKVAGVTNIKESLNGTGLNFYPNPVSNSLTIEFSDNNLPQDLSIEVINALGTTVFFAPAGTNTTTLNMSGYSSGIYYVKLKSGDSVVNKMIVKN